MITHPRPCVTYPRFTRRHFIGTTAAAAALGTLGARAAEEPTRKIKLGAVGLGGRGHWIAGLFRKHGGYDIVAVADYFQEVANQRGGELGVEASRRFSTLSGYKRVLESGIEAILLETPPFFFPEHARAAIEAGLHVYMAKPVAVDTWGCGVIKSAGESATKNHRCFLVDYQMPTDPVNLEVAARIRDGALGKLAQVLTMGVCGGFADPPKGPTIESRLRNLTWVNDVALGADYIGNYDIHAIDAALWVLGQRPVAASGSSRICRADPHGDSRDVCSVIYEYADSLVHNHYGQGLGNNSTGELSATIHGTQASAVVNYWGKAFVRGGNKHFGGGTVENLYEAGAVRNIARFYDEVTSGKLTNDTCQRAVDGALTCFLGREAAARHQRLTMEELLKENQRLEVNLSGLKT